MDKQQVLDRIREAGLSRITADVEALLKPSIRLTAHASDDAQIRVGASKLGGLPDLPPNVAWPQCESLDAGASGNDDPYHEGGPLWFLGQINLADVAHLDFDHQLPRTGLLYFFAALWRDNFPDDGSNGDSWKVIYYDGDPSLLQRKPVPPLSERLQRTYKGPEHSFQSSPCSLHFTEYAMLPWYLDEKVSLTVEEQYLFFDNFSDVYAGRNKSNHHLLGYPHPVQGNYTELQCEAFLSPSDTSKPQVEHEFWGLFYVPKTEQERKVWYDNLDAERSCRASWQLLFQVDTDPDIGLEWNAWARGYFWIRREDLAARNFDRVCLVTQHT